MSTKLERAVKQLVSETEDVDDSLVYAPDIAKELGLTQQVVEEEIRRQWASKPA